MHILSGLAEGQVLQRLSSRLGANVTLSGTAPQAGDLFVTLSNSKGPLKGWKSRRAGKAARGKFSFKLANIPAGGPYRLEIGFGKSGPKAVIKQFFVGDVWLLAGQSNMEGVGNREGAARPHPLVRSFSMARVWRLAEDSLHLRFESPDRCHNDGNPLTPKEADHARQHAPKGVGVGVFFGREMLSRSGVPQGLICTAHGGTSMEQWSPKLKDNGGDSLYGSMLASLRATGQPVAGMLWYQGESDASPAAAALYTPGMKALVASVRRDLRQPRLPWLMVQIARVVETRTREGIRAWNSVQEQERLLPKIIPNLETVSAIDLALDDPIHISASEFPLLASRLAQVAERMVYGNHKLKRPPQVGKISQPRPANGRMTVDIAFDEVVGGLHAGSRPSGFSVLDAEGNELPLIHNTTLHGHIVRLHLNQPSLNGLFLSHGHGTAPYCNIRDRRGFALPVFGPIQQGRPAAILPFVRTWKVSKIVTGAPPLGTMDVPDIDRHEPVVKTYAENGFVNEQPQWRGNAGHGYFSARIRLPEPMRLTFLMGYDGPFRLWLDQQPLFTDLKGTNPCFQDKSAKSATLDAGLHDIRVAMDLNNGKSWGFFLRLARTDLTPALIQSNAYARPEYLS